MPFHPQHHFNLALTASLLLHLFFLFGIAIQLSENSPVAATPGRLHAAILSLEKQGVATMHNSALPAPHVTKEQPVIPKRKTERRVLPNNNNQARPLPNQQPSQKEITHTPEKASAKASVVPVNNGTGLTLAGENHPAVPGVHHGGNLAGEISTGKANPNPAEEAQKRLDQQEVQQYRWHLGKAIKRFKRYPGLARERGWEGNAEFSIDFAAMRHVPEIILKRSSGRELLDSQALEMIRQAINVTSLPENLRGHNFHIPLTVEFHLEEAS